MKLNTIPASATLAINTLASQKKAAGERVYNLSAGEPMLKTDTQVTEAVVHAITDGKTLYTPALGIPELRMVATEWMNKNFATNFSNKNVAITNGGKFGLYALCRALLNAGDEAIVVAPYWTSYPSLIDVTGAKTVVVTTSEKNNWKMSATDLRAVITAKTRAIFFNNASNPTGTLYSKAELKELIAVAAEKNIWFISDEVYSGLTYEQEFCSAASFPEYQESVIVVQSISKHFAMTGWRVGLVFAVPEIIQAIGDWQSQITSGTATVSQYAALAAFQNSESINASVRTEMKERRDTLAKALQSNFNKNISAPAAGLYIFVSLQNLGIGETDDVKFCEDLLKDGNIALVPGSAFGMPGYVRFSFGAPVPELLEAVEALTKYLKT